MVELRPRTPRGTVAKTDAQEILRDLDAESVDGPSGNMTRESSDRPAVEPPVVLQFPQVVALSLALSSLGYSLLGRAMPGELTEAWKSLDTWGDVAIVTGWRVLELAIGWFGRFDSFDLAALSVLSRGPSLYLLATFYHVRTAAALAALAIDAISVFVPFQLLRPVSGVHAGGRSVPNREIITDPLIQISTTALSSMVYSITLFAAYRTFLPRVLVLYFGGIPTVAPAYDATYLSVIPVAILLGLAAKVFIFTPFVGTGRSAEDKKLRQFDPVRASLQETFVHNVWGYTAKGKVGIVRTAVVVLFTFVNTYLQCTKLIAGIEPTGAIYYAAVWATAALFSGISLGHVGSW